MMKDPKWVLKFFHEIAESVPAYKLFLKENGIKPGLIRNISDFNKIPCIDKKKYLRKYPFADLFPKRKIPPMVSTSSGSSGRPFFWPRGNRQEKEGGEIHERIFKDIFKIKNDNTLVVVCFSMGTWIAGTYTEACCRWVADQGYNLSIITPGINKEDILSVLEGFASNFERVILAGYPPFLMDIINESRARGVNLKKLNLQLLFAGENFSEKWRNIIHGLAKIDNSLSGSINIYGTADAAILGHETPLSIFLRQAAANNNKLKSRLFGGNYALPSFIQYYPQYKFFQKEGEELIFTAKSGIPLIRYNINDSGELLSYKAVALVIKEFKLGKELPDKKILEQWKLPFIVLRDRKDIAVTFYALNIYPDNIKAGLEDEKVSQFLTGKFIAEVAVVNYGKEQKFKIKLELNKGIRAGKRTKELAVNSIVQNLKKLNTEYRSLYNSIGEKAFPQIELLPFGDEIFILKKSKYKWVKLC